jgi:hypothetical protein
VLAVFAAGHSAPALRVLAVLGVGLGVAAWRVGVAVAVRRVRDRQPELLAKLSARP